MNTVPVGTKRALIEAAGELFAECGFAGASIRAIAERAGANVAAINYHFGTKENLYTETLRHAVTHDDAPQVQAYLDSDTRLNSPEGISAVLLEIMRGKYLAFLNPDVPTWHRRILVRSLIEPSPSLMLIVEEHLIPEHEATVMLAQLAKPGIAELDARLTAFALLSPLAFLEFARAPILRLLHTEDYDESFLEAAARHHTRMLTALLGLPSSEAPSA